ncbi:hypothetical protein HYFRA_00005386 [Hymenoscyphus fraxineus]|uniref:SYO1-like TPR repeats domain-containing protein n=1 Tax=Hymenoscyphus fraxineus TaxID=746836 RepID=A0A9N9PWC4_9HELO|nr:hypothetical protein HYFRA_00005386 [Hymenoscyphus fraxineus]
MGKSKPRNRQRNRQDPTSKPTKPPSDPELASIREQRILPVLKDLTSADLATRSSAATAIANLIEDTKCRKLLLREKIVQILFEQTLTDSSLETRTSGWGILRNLALEEEADFCIHLYRQDVLTAIEGTIKTVIQTIESTEVPFSSLPKPHQELAWNLTSSLISLLSSLSEAQDEIVEAVSKLPTILNFLFGLLAFELTPREVSNEVLSCLTTLTEDNKPTVQQIVDNGDWVKGLMQLKDSKTPLAVTACGTLHNIFSTMGWSDHDRPIDGASDASLIPTLVHYMETSVANIKATNGHSTNSTPDQILQLALEITASIATSLQEALEHGHEKEFKGFDDPIDTEDMDDDNEEGEAGEEGDDDEMNDDEIAADMDLVTRDGPDEDSDEPTLELLIRTATPKILAMAAGITHNDVIRDCAISTLNNIAWTVSSIDFSNSQLDGIQKFWATMAQSIWSSTISPVLASDTADIDLASIITSLAWAISRSVRGVIKLKPDEPKKFMALYQASKNIDTTVESQANGNSKAEESPDLFQGLGVKCIGVLGSLAVDPAPIELNREIGIFLITTLAALPDTPAANAVEALNQVFDIYSDKSYAFDEPVFWGNGFYKHLEDILPKARKMTKSIDKRKFEELRARADEAVLNFGRFLKYKKTEHEKMET